MPIYLYNDIPISRNVSIYVYIYISLAINFRPQANFSQHHWNTSDFCNCWDTELKNLKWDRKCLQVTMSWAAWIRKSLVFCHTWLGPAWTDPLAPQKRTDQYCQVKSQFVIGKELPSQATQNSTVKEKILNIKWKVAHLTDYFSHFPRRHLYFAEEVS